jgi:hypothetical protein
MTQATASATHTAKGETKHAADCKMSFGRKDASCPRCQELLAGAPARKGWQTEHFAAKSAREEQQKAAIRAHFAPNGPHAKGECGPVCTAFD